MVCAFAGMMQAYQWRQKLSKGLNWFWPRQARGVVRNLVLVADTFLSFCAFLLSALLPDGPQAYEVYCGCSAIAAACWLAACHFDFNGVALVSFIFSLMLPPSLWYRSWTCRQHVAGTLLVSSVMKVDLLGGPVQFIQALDMLR